jgi:hypothetical protein
MTLDQAKPEGFDALMLPGAVINPDSLRIQPKALAFAKVFFNAGKPVAANCHRPWTVIGTGPARGRRGYRVQVQNEYWVKATCRQRETLPIAGFRARRQQMGWHLSGQAKEKRHIH